MLAGVARQLVGDLFGRGHPRIGKQIPPERPRKIYVQHYPRKVRAVVVDQVEMGSIGARIQACYDRIILLQGGHKPERVGASFKRNSNQLGPAAAHEISFEDLFAKRVEMFLVIMVAQATHHGAVDPHRNIGKIFYRVEIGNQRHRHPVIAGNALVAGNHGASFSGLAAAQFHRGLRADIREIDGGMAGGIESPEESVRLFQ